MFNIINIWQLRLQIIIKYWQYVHKQNVTAVFHSKINIVLIKNKNSNNIHAKIISRKKWV